MTRAPARRDERRTSVTDRSAWRRVVRALDAWETEVFRRTAARRSPALNVVLPALTLAANRPRWPGTARSGPGPPS